MNMKHLLPTLLFFLFLPSLVFSSEEPCYVGVKTSKEFNTVLVSEISSSLISQYITEVESIPPSGLSGEPSCIFEVSVTKDGEKTFVTLKGNNLNSFGDSQLDRDRWIPRVHSEVNLPFTPVLVGVYWKMKKEKLNEWGYPIHPEMNFLKPEGDFETRIALIIAFSLIIIGIII